MNHDEVRARVEAFVADFHRRWERAGRAPSGFTFDPAIFEAWTRELAELVAAHFTAGASTGAEGSLSGNPAHDPSSELITDLEVEVDHATVRSMMESGGMPTYYECRLERVDRQWRISQLLSFLDPPGAPLVDPAKVEAMLNSATWTPPSLNSPQTSSSTSPSSSPRVDRSPPSAKPSRSRSSASETLNAAQGCSPSGTSATATST